MSQNGLFAHIHRDGCGGVSFYAVGCRPEPNDRLAAELPGKWKLYWPSGEACKSTDILACPSCGESFMARAGYFEQVDESNLPEWYEKSKPEGV